MMYQQLRKYRLLRGISQQALAKALGLPQTTIARVELGRAHLSEEEWGKVSAVLQVPRDKFAEPLGEFETPLKLALTGAEE